MPHELAMPIINLTVSITEEIMSLQLATILLIGVIMPMIVVVTTIYTLYKLKLL